MDGRFFGIPRSPYRPAYYYSVPVHQRPQAKSPKLVSIPVHFVESEPTRTRTGPRTESAVKIQAAFRGFIVRKYVRKLDVVRREVEVIERKVCEEETAELMRRDQRERLKVNEALMSSLFRLDLVRGVDAGVRDLRKKVIKKVIALQEKVDAIAAGADFADQKEGGAAEVEQSEEGGVDSPDSPDQEEAEAEQIEEQVDDLPDGEEGGSAAAQSEEPALVLPDQEKEGGVEAEQCEERMADVLDQKVGCGETEQSEEDRDIDLPNQEEGGVDGAKQIVEQVDDGSSEVSDHIGDIANDACYLMMVMDPAVFETSGESRSDPSFNPESFLEEVDENTPVKENDDEEAEQAELFEEKAVEEEDKDSGHGKENNRSEEMLGKMMEDNEKMMGMMMQLFDRNERQTQLLSLLSQRVERLEKAFICEKLRREKNRQAVDGERLVDSNKCGKKL